MARPDAVSPPCYPHSLDLRFMQFSLYLGLRAAHVQLCSRTMNSSGRVVSSRAFSTLKMVLICCVAELPPRSECLALEECSLAGCWLPCCVLT